MLKRMTALLMAGTMALGLVGCGQGDSASATQSSNAAATESGDKKFDLKFTAVSVPGDTHTDGMQIFADKVSELSEGTINVKVYHSGSLFTSGNELDALINGDVELAYISNPTLATKIDYFNMFTSGYFFKNYEHMTETFNGDIAKTRIRKDIQDTLGVVPLSTFYIGSRQVNTTKKPINSYEDMKGVLLRMPNSPAWLFLGEALGANPTPMAFNEVYTGLSTGAIDAQDNPLPTVDSAKFYEVTDYLAITNHVIDSITPCITEGVWNQMSEKQQQAMYDAMEYTRDYCDTINIEKEANLIKFFEEKGLTITYPDVEDFKEKVQGVYLANEQQVAKWDMDLYEQIQALAK